MDCAITAAADTPIARNHATAPRFTIGPPCAAGILASARARPAPAESDNRQPADYIWGVPSRLSRLLPWFMLAVALPSSALGGDERWGVSIWGLSYHVDRSVDYNEDNWGLGLRYYFKPDKYFVAG